MKKKTFAMLALMFVLSLSGCDRTVLSSSTQPDLTTTTGTTTTTTTTTTTSTTTTTTTTTTTSQVVEYDISINGLSNVSDVSLWQDDVQIPLLGTMPTLSAKANQDAKLTLKVTPSEHFGVESALINSEPLVYSEQDGGYSFVLNSSVEITFDIQQFEFVVTKLYTATSMIYNSEVTILNGNDAVNINETYIAKDSDLIVRISNQQTYYLDMLVEGLYVHVNDVSYHPNIDAYDGEATYFDVTIKMPASNAQIYVTFNGYYSLDQSEESLGFTIDIDYPSDCLKIIGWDEGDKFDAGYFQATIIRQEGFKITSMQRQNEGETTWSDMSIPTFTDNVANLTISPFNSNVKIKIEGELVELRNVNYVNKDLVTVSNYTPFVDKMIPGEMFTLSGISAADENSYISNIEIVGVENPSISYNFSNITFVMPDNDVTITFTVSENGTVTVTPNDGVESYYFTDNVYGGSQVTSLKPGSYYYVVFTLKDGYKLTNGELVNGGNTTTLYAVNDSYYGSYYNFNMPSDGSDVTINVGVSQVHTISYEYNQQHLSSAPTTTSSAAGENISIYVSLVSNLVEITGASIKDHPEITVSLSGNYINFVMPDFDIVIVIETAEKDTIPVLVTSDENIESFSIYQYTSNISINATTASYSQSHNFLAGSVNISNVKAKEGYVPSLVITNDSVDQTIDGEFVPYTGSYVFNNVTINESTTKIAFVSKANTPQKIIVNDETGDNVTYTITHNGEIIDSLENHDVYLNDSILVNVTSTASEGYAYVVEYKVGDTTLENINGSYYVIGPLTVTITKVEAYTYTIIDNFESGYSSVTTYDNEYNYINNGDLIFPGDVININSINTSGPFNITITNGSEVVVDQDCQFNYCYLYEQITVQGNVVVTITPLQ